MDLAPPAEREVLTVRVAGGSFALPAADIAEIIRPMPLTRVPHAPASLLGVANLRGAVLPVVSLAALLGRVPDQSGPAAAARVVVIDNGARVGLLVDEVASLDRHFAGATLDPATLLTQGYDALLHRPGTDSRGPHEAPGAALLGPSRTAQPPRQAAVEQTLLVFRLGAQEYALPLDQVAEVAGLPTDIAELPGRDAAMLGIASMRGATLPLVSLRVLLGLPPAGFERTRARVVVAEPGGGRLGLVVDEVTAILHVPPDAIDPVPAVLTRFRGEARIEAICRLDHGRRLVAILSTAGLFDADTTARMLDHATQHAEQQAAARAPQAALHQFVVMQLGDEQYGLPIGAVDEVARCPDSFARVPHAPAFLAGVMNLRGQPVPVIDQRRRFAFAGPPAAGRRRVVVVTIGGLRAGLLVDGISALLEVSAAELRRLPPLNGRGGLLFDRAAPVERDGGMILLIEPDVLLGTAEADLLGAFAATRPDIAPDMAHPDSSAA